MYLAQGRRILAGTLLLVSVALGLVPLLLARAVLPAELATAAHTGFIVSRLQWSSADTPALMLLAVALIASIVWRRARYFGNFAPLLVATVLIAFRYLPPLVSLDLLLFAPPMFGLAVPFICTFAGGVWVDLLESTRTKLWISVAAGLLALHAIAGVLHSFVN
jgi:hypothetical protein